MPDLIITSHALSRALERIPGITTVDQARRVLAGPAIARAAEFGARFVKLGTGQHVVIQGGAIVTVLPRDMKLGCFDPRRDGRFGHA